MLNDAIAKLTRKNYLFIPEETSNFKRVVIYGAGGRSLTLPNELAKYGVTVDYFLDSDSRKHGTTHADLEVKDPRSVTIEDDVAVLISSTFWKMIYSQCKEYGFKNVFFDFQHNAINRVGELFSDYRRYEKVYSMLEDDASRETFAAFIKTRRTGDRTWLKVSEFEALFHPVVGPQKGDTIMDIGCWEGDSCVRFMERLEGQCKIHAFEVEPDIIKRASVNLEKYGDSIELVAKGVGSRSGMLTFQKTDACEYGGLKDLTRGTHNEKTQLLSCESISIDDYCAKTKTAPDYIWIASTYNVRDIVAGANETLKKHRPRLVMYAMNPFILELFEDVQAIVPEARFYLGVHHFGLESWTTAYVDLS